MFVVRIKALVGTKGRNITTFHYMFLKLLFYFLKI